MASTSYDEQQCTPNAATATTSSSNSGPSCNAINAMANAPVPEARTPSRPSSPLPTNDNCDYNNSNNSPNNISASATISNSRSVSPTSPNHQQLDHPPLPMQTNSSRPSTPSSVQSLSLPTSPQSIANHPTASSTLLPETKEKLKQEKKERHATKKLMKELASCKTMLDEMEVNPRRLHQTPHEHGVNLFLVFDCSCTKNHGHSYCLSTPNNFQRTRKS